MSEEQKVPSDDEGLEGGEEKAEADEQVHKEITEGLKSMADEFIEKLEESMTKPKGEKSILSFEVNDLGIEVTHKVKGMSDADYIVFLTLVKRTVDRMMEKRLDAMASPEMPLSNETVDGEECNCPGCTLKRSLMGKMFEENEDG